MRNLRGTYVHRGDAARRRRRFNQTLFATGLLAATWYVVSHRYTASANAEPVVQDNRPSIFSRARDTRKLRQELENARGELALMRAQYDRADRIIQYSTRYEIGAGLAGKIFDGALREGVDPELAFRVVRLESEFNHRATSHVGALGLMQLMPSTAQYFVKGLTHEQLYDPDLNLKIGMRYLRILLKQYKGDVRLALLAYNRGDAAVDRDLQNGINPANGYDRHIMKGYKGKGLVD
jgi:soluble lytic murein transglycosylase-like protein